MVGDTFALAYSIGPPNEFFVEHSEVTLRRADAGHRNTHLAGLSLAIEKERVTIGKGCERGGLSGDASRTGERPGLALVG